MAGLPAAELEQQLYEAAVVPELWPAVLDRLSDMAGAAGGVAFGVVDAAACWVSSPAIRDAMSAFVRDGWHVRNCRATMGFAKRLDQEPRFVTEADMFDSRDFLREPIYQQFFLPNGLGWHAGTVISVPHGDRLILSVERPLPAGPVPASAVAALNRARPHLARAAMVGARLSFEKSRTAVETLAALGLPAFAMTGHGRLLLTNRLFDAEADGWTTRGGDRLVLADQRAGRLVGRALEGIERPEGIRSVPLVERDGDMPAVLHIIPMRRSAHDLFHGAAAIGVLSRPTRKPNAATAVLQALFDLTPAEARVAVRIASGETVDEIARRDRRSVETVRGHLKRVQAKTGCRRQTELAALLPQLLFPS